MRRVASLSCCSRSGQAVDSPEGSSKLTVAEQTKSRRPGKIVQKTDSAMTEWQCCMQGLGEGSMSRKRGRQAVLRVEKTDSKSVMKYTGHQMGKCRVKQRLLYGWMTSSRVTLEHQSTTDGTQGWSACDGA